MVAVFRNFHAEVFERSYRAAVILAAGKIVDPAPAVSDAREDNGPMSDGLIPGQSDLAAQRTLRLLDFPDGGL
jgi:hypothetical protein